jgi:hypothetical protein
VIYWLAGLRAMVLLFVLRKGFSFTQSLNFVTWSSSVCLAVMPVGMISQQLFDFGFGWAVWIFVALIGFWALMRLIGVIKRYTKRSFPLIAGLWLIGPIIVLVTVIMIIEYHKHISLYLGYFWRNLI